MSDQGRKDLGDKAEDKLTPESQKTLSDKVSEGATDAYDKAAGAVQPEGDKSVTQKLTDSTSTKPGEKGYVEQAQDMAAGAAKYVQDTAT
ncbi:MAG: hypothetical protein Q9217_005516, partial [Psora testacea]